MHYQHWQGKEPNLRTYFQVVAVGMFWALSIHTITAFLFSANAGRPLWHTALLGPRFIASAFVSGPTLLIIVLQLIRRFTDYPVKQGVIDLLALVMATALQISLFFVLAELFTDGYNEISLAKSIRYLFFGLHGLNGLQAWTWTTLRLNLVAVVQLSVHRTLRAMPTLNLACVLAFKGNWAEKGMGLVVPGFIPTPLGEVFEYSPSATELLVSLGIWASGPSVPSCSSFWQRPASASNSARSASNGPRRRVRAPRPRGGSRCELNAAQQLMQAARPRK